MTEPAISLVEAEFQRLMNAMTPAERSARMVNLMEWGRTMLARQTVEEHGELPADELKWRVALKLYGRNADLRPLIEREVAHVSS